MMYYFKSAGLGYAADGTALPPELSINPLIKAFNAVGYDAMTLGNHEFNFGSEVFGTLAQADFPILQANVTDDGAYGLASVPVEPYTEKTVGAEAIEVAILGIGNHRVPSYELPSNIPGLTFTDPIQAGKDYAPGAAGGQRRRHRPHPHRVHHRPQERRGRQQRRHLLRRAGRGRRRRDRRAQPHQPGHRVRRLQVPADLRGGTGRRPRPGHPGLPLQHLPRRGRARPAGQGRRRLRGRLQRRPVPPGLGGEPRPRTRRSRPWCSRTRT